MNVALMRYLRPHHALLLSCALASLSCTETKGSQLTLQVGPGQTIQFEPKSAFAHYFELRGEPDVLRLFMASYEMGCQEYKSPEPGDVFVSVTVTVPEGEKLKLGNAMWEGLSLPTADTLLPGEKVVEEAPRPQVSALPFVRLAEEGRSLPPGGHLKLNEFQRSPHGLIRGELAFRDGGEGQAATAALLGEFEMRLCHLELDPARVEKSPEK